jgi:RNA polymerase sigma-70 factor (ECF subfamily)
MPDETRITVIDELRRGSRPACEWLIHTHHAAIYRFLLHLTRDPVAAEELTQDTFASVWTRLALPDQPARIRTWLHRIAYHRFVDFWRQRRRQARLPALAAANLMRARTVLPGESLAAGECAQELYDAVATLPAPQRAVVVLHYFQGLAFDDIAGVLDEPVGTVRWRAHRALRQLREKLGEEYNHEHTGKRQPAGEAGIGVAMPASTAGPARA